LSATADPCICRSLSVYPSITSRCSTETDKLRITQTTPHDSPVLVNILSATAEYRRGEKKKK